MWGSPGLEIVAPAVSLWFDHVKRRPQLARNREESPVNEAVQPLIGQAVKVEADGPGLVRGTLEAYDHPWLRLRTEKDKILCVPIYRLLYVEST
jgi:hypothetical protein